MINDVVYRFQGEKTYDIKGVNPERKTKGMYEHSINRKAEPTG